jgi:hypothetical protein
MATGGLRKFQVILIGEELADLWSRSITPGMWGSQMIGNKYVTSSPSREATFPTDKYDIKLEAPAKVATIGEVCTDKRLKLALANVFPNRPGWMGALVWRALLAADPQAAAAEEIAKLVKAQDAKAPPAEEKPASADAKKPAKAKPKKPVKETITAATAADAQAYKDLQALVWPSGENADQDKLLANYNAVVLQFYKGEDEETLPDPKTWEKHPVKQAKTGKNLRYGWKSRSERLASSEAGL